VADDNLMDFHGDTSVEATAFALKLLTQTRPTSPLLEKAAYWLVTKRDDGYYWNTTKQTAMAIYGLIDYVKQSKELKPNFTVTVSKGDRQLLSRRFTDADVFATDQPVIRLSSADVAAGSNAFKITKSGEGRLYWSARAEYYSAGEQLSGTGSASLSISREYFRLTPVQEGGRVIHQLEPLTGPLAPGDVLAVRLVVTGGPWRYLMTEDPIPSGAEFVTRDDLYQIRNKPPWWQFGFTRREFRDDRAALFQTYFSRETMQQIYLLKVVNPGTFRISPARAQPMYQPQFLATSDSRVLEVR
jgi:alpha-2-macroglobulin